jgi:hypothetical protein
MTDEPKVSFADAIELQELWLGSNNMGSVFPNREALAEAWRRHRDFAMREWAKLGRRPLAWWEFECPPGLRYDDDHEQSILYEAHVVIGEERIELERYWREEFERAQAFDVKARHKHFRDIDLPASLRRKWSAERRRSRKTIKRLATASDEREQAREL